MNRRNFLTMATAVASSSVIGQTVSASSDNPPETELVASFYETADGWRIGTLVEQEAEWLVIEFVNTGAFALYEITEDVVDYETSSAKSVYFDVEFAEEYIDDSLEVWTEGEDGQKLSERVVVQE